MFQASPENKFFFESDCFIKQLLSKHKVMEEKHEIIVRISFFFFLKKDYKRSAIFDQVFNTLI